MILDVFNAVTGVLVGLANPPPILAAQCFLGPEFIRQEAAPPRIVWVPTREGIPAPRKTQQGAAPFAPRPLKSRDVGVDIHIWQLDYPTTEALWQSLEQAVHQTMVGAYDLEGASWDGVASLTRSGRVLTAHYRFLIPLVDVSSTTAIVTAVPLTTQMLSP